jgi:heme exporter protein B
MIRTMRLLVTRDLRLALRQGSDAAMVIAFFVITVTLFPLGVGPEPNVLARIAAGVVWVTALLATMLSLDRLFQSDYEDGSTDLLILAPVPLELVVLAKVLAHWMLTGLPLILTAPVLAALMNLPEGGYLVLIVSMFLATPTLSLIGSVGAALALGARRGGILISLLVLPLYIPVLIDHRPYAAPASADSGRNACRRTAARPMGGCSGIAAQSKMSGSDVMTRYSVSRGRSFPFGRNLRLEPLRLEPLRLGLRRFGLLELSRLGRFGSDLGASFGFHAQED